MRKIIGLALGAAMLAGLPLVSAQAGVIGPASTEAVSTGDSALVTQAHWWGHHGYWRHRHWGYRGWWGGYRHYGYGGWGGPRFYGWGGPRYAYWGRRCWWRPSYWGPVRVCRW